MLQLKTVFKLDINDFPYHLFYFHLSLFFLFFDAAPPAFIETLREKMFKPSLSTIVNENTKYSFCSKTNLLEICP